MRPPLFARTLLAVIAPLALAAQPAAFPAPPPAKGPVIVAADLAPPVQMALSAMTAHLVLNAEGYVLNPF